MSRRLVEQIAAAKVERDLGEPFVFVASGRVPEAILAILSWTGKYFPHLECDNVGTQSDLQEDKSDGNLQVE